MMHEGVGDRCREALMSQGVTVADGLYQAVDIAQKIL